MDFNNHFKLPIYYNKEKISLKQNIVDDLELIKTIDGSNNPIYDFFFENDTPFSKKLMEQTCQYYTTDTIYLKETQKLIQAYEKSTSSFQQQDYSKILSIWDEIKNDTGFKEKYYYLDWEMLEFLNKSEIFLQFMSIYNIVSPILSLMVPIFILIIPFFIVKMKGLDLTFNEYVGVLKTIISQHAIAKLFTEFNTVSMNQKIYLLVSAAFYIFSIYQNIALCIKFNNNMIKIHQHFIRIKEYLDHTIDSIDNYSFYSKHLESHQMFLTVLLEKRSILAELREKLSFISEYKLTPKKMFELGHVLKYFYELFSDKDYEDAFLYSFGFNGYIRIIESLKENAKKDQIHFAEFIKKKQNSIIHNNYYAVLKNLDPVKNTVKLGGNLIITGPNASGKTTLLKSLLVNIILTQQFGCGFYDSAKIKPYKYIHCYLNIPDTSGRDSLFQAEARRCKEIIDMVSNHKKDTHFCIFDELYSGTNPEEATRSAITFMEYLAKRKNISSMLTTHYIKVCKKLNDNKNIGNYHMKIEKQCEGDFNYTYKLSKGISEIKGGFKVLKDMNYPEEIMKGLREREKNIQNT